MATIRLHFAVSLGLHAVIVASAFWVAGPAGEPHREPARITVANSEASAVMPAAEQVTLPVWSEPVVEQELLPDPPVVVEPELETSHPEPPAVLPDAAWTARTRMPAGQELARWRAPAAAPMPITVADPAVPVPEPSRAVPDESVTVLVPEPGSNEPPAYPPLARRRGWQGSVLVRIACDAHGVVCTAQVVRSSGHRILDDAAVTAVWQWRFLNGPGTIEQPIEFRLRG